MRGRYRERLDRSTADPPSKNPRDIWDRSEWERAVYEFDPERRLLALHKARVESLNDRVLADVGILAGSDTLGGSTLHEELEIVMEVGLSPLRALATDTLAPARIPGREADLGSIATGRFTGV
ncbi:MAG: hypothetical protein P8188_13355 [Gemmatimonadota bacterium]